MTEIERKALAWVESIRPEDAYRAPRDFIDKRVLWNALCRAIEQYESFRQEVSDVLEYVRDNTAYDVHPKLWRFILPKPDPLVEAWMDAFPGNHIDDAREECAKINATLAARGLEIREKQP